MSYQDSVSGKTFIISDTHFWHSRILQYSNRPFATVEEMNNKIIENWKKMVRPCDTIWHLGDVGLCNKEKMTEIIQSLPGHKNLILGNHDHHSINRWKDIGFEFVSPYPIIYKKWFIMSHDIVFLNELIPYCNIHGHTHCLKMDSKQYINVCVENTNYSPINLDKLIEDMKTKESE